MSLTGKTIGQLTLLSEVTNNTLFPVEYEGVTYHIPYSSLTVSNYSEVTYQELLTLISNEELTPGSFYLITDFQTIYDQPDYDFSQNPITGNNQKEGPNEPLLVMSTSNNTLSSQAFSLQYPKDIIKYDVTFTETEITNTPTKGRITERIDEFNNRTDYDHRTILFKRYEYYEIPFSQPENGTVNVVSTSDTEMTVTGTNTNFESLSVGQFVGFDSNGFNVYEITAISGDTEMYITGFTNTNLNNVKYYIASDQGYVSYYQNNVSTAYTEYYTFDYQNTNLNNYIGDFASFYNEEGNSFILANNIFIGSSYLNNKFGNMCYNNSFDDDCSNNSVGNYCYNNITNDDFDGNVIGNWFRNNKITSNFQHNRIGENFQDNYLVQSSFNRNNIGNYFDDNIIDGDSFQNNEIGNQFNNNKLLYGQFFKNDIGNGFNNNNIYSEFYGNLVGNGFNDNNIYCNFYENYIGEIFENNNLGDQNNYGSYVFKDNKIGNSFYDNTCEGDFSYNIIGAQFENNTIGDGFGYGFSTSQGNVIGNYFYQNTIGEYFYNNTIADGFYDNETLDYFQLNNIKTSVFGTDFTEFYGNITAFTYTANGSTATDDRYVDLAGSTDNIGVNSTFNVDVISGVVDSVTLNTEGKYYAINDTITIVGSQIGGTDGNDDISITVTGISPIPSVYELYNCDIFKNAANNNRLSYYDAFDILTIKNINE